jgi:hypothetical protein
MIFAAFAGTLFITIPTLPRAKIGTLRIPNACCTYQNKPSGASAIKGEMSIAITVINKPNTFPAFTVCFSVAFGLK